MIEKNKALVVDIDGTLCDIKGASGSYLDVSPEPLMVNRIQEMKADGWRIILSSSRGMRSNDGNLGMINKNVAPTLIEWLDIHEIPYDELHLGKPWPGSRGLYIDDRSVRPREFLEKSLDELEAIMESDRVAGSLK